MSYNMVAHPCKHGGGFVSNFCAIPFYHFFVVSAYVILA